MLNPQAFSESVWKLTSLLQEYFGCFVGANVSVKCFELFWSLLLGYLENVRACLLAVS